MEDIILFADGAYSRTQNVGGWAFILRYKEHKKIESGQIANTTNNRCELMSVIKGLQSIKKVGSNVIIYSDSTYVCDTINKWIGSFIKDPTRPNYDLIMELYQELIKHNARAEWIRGHTGIYPDHELVDKLAKEARLGKI